MTSKLRRQRSTMSASWNSIPWIWWLKIQTSPVCVSFPHSHWNNSIRIPHSTEVAPQVYAGVDGSSDTPSAQWHFWVGGFPVFCKRLKEGNEECIGILHLVFEKGILWSWTIPNGLGCWYPCTTQPMQLQTLLISILVQTDSRNLMSFYHSIS